MVLFFLLWESRVMGVNVPYGQLEHSVTSSLLLCLPTLLKRDPSPQLRESLTGAPFLLQCQQYAQAGGSAHARQPPRLRGAEAPKPGHAHVRQAGEEPPALPDCVW